MKRYDLYTDEVTGDTFEQEDALGCHVRFTDAEAMRRRLLVKLLRARLGEISHEPTCYQANRDQWCRRCKTRHNRIAWLRNTADGIESNQPLTYFQRLGEDK